MTYSRPSRPIARERSAGFLPSLPPSSIFASPFTIQAQAQDYLQLEGLRVSEGGGRSISRWIFVPLSRTWALYLFVELKP